MNEINPKEVARHLRLLNQLITIVPTHTIGEAFHLGVIIERTEELAQRLDKMNEFRPAWKEISEN